MVESKAWNWSKNTESFWQIPAEESHYLVTRWQQKGFKEFLDLGCGIGRHAIQFARSGFNVVAFDLSEFGINVLNQQLATFDLPIHTSCGDMTSLPFTTDTFDCLLAYHVISHTDTVGIKKVISEIQRVLKPGGEFYLSLCSKNAWSFKEAGFPRVDENTVIKIEDGPENGIPHFYADEKLISQLFNSFQLETVKQVQDLLVNGKEYGSWHYYILGNNNVIEKE